MRDRLVELLKSKVKFRSIHISLAEKFSDVAIEAIADHLLANGVILPPCKVGTTLYFLYDSPYADVPDFTPHIYKTYRWYFDVDTRGISIKPRDVHGYKGNYHYYLGKTVFLTREEAEKALKERSEQ